MLNLNLSGKLLVNSYFMKPVFSKITKMLGHQMATEWSPSINKFIRSDLFYVDDRLVYNFLRAFLDENLAKLFYFRFFNILIESDSKHSMRSEQFESWAKQHYWAFDAPENLYDEVFQIYFRDNDWIKKFLDNFENEY